MYGGEREWKMSHLIENLSSLEMESPIINFIGWK